MIYIFLITGYVSQSFKVAVIKPLLYNPTLDPEVLANNRIISKLHLMSKILEKVVVKSVGGIFYRIITYSLFSSLVFKSIAAQSLH